MAEIDDAELEALREKAASADALATQLAEQTTATEQAKADVDAATLSVRNALVAANPHIPEDLIQGETIQAIEASLAVANTIHNRLAEAAAAAPKAPIGFVTGGTQRQAAQAPEGIRGIERIRYGLANRSV